MLTPLLLVLIAFVAGLSRGFSGFGAALIFMPLASALIGPKLASPVLMLSDMVFGLPLGLRAMKLVKPSGIGLMLLGAVTTIPLGTLILLHFDEMALRWFIVGLVAVMLIVLASGWKFAGEAKVWLSILVGAISGLFSGIAQVGGPPVVAYYLGQRNINAASIRASIFLFFAATSVIGLVTYAIGGLLSWEAARFACLTGPAYGLGIFGGSRIFRLASETVFRRASLALIAVGLLASLPIW